MLGFPLEIIGARCPAERLPAHRRIIYLNSLDYFTRLLDVGLGLVTFEHEIQEPDNETVRQQNERAYQTRPMPEVTKLNRDQPGSRTNHQQLGPTLLHVNADSFGEED